MYGVLWRYRVDARQMDSLIERIEAELLPLVAAMPGFVSNRILRFSPGLFALLSTFAERVPTEEAVMAVDRWIAANLQPQVAERPGPCIGRVHPRRAVTGAAQPWSRWQPPATCTIAAR